MLAAVGWVVQERWHPLFGGDIEGERGRFTSQSACFLLCAEASHRSCAGPAVSHFQQVPTPFWELLVQAVGVAEAARSRRGWEEPKVAQSWFKLRRSYTPGMYLSRCRARASARADGIVLCACCRSALVGR